MNKLFERYFFARNKLDRKHILSLLKFYEESQYWTYESLVSYQVEQFNLLWKHALENVPYYKSMLASGKCVDKIRSLEDLAAIPTMDKEEIRKNGNALLAKNMPGERFIKNSTSGFSGSNLQFYSDRENIDSYTAFAMRRYHWMNASIFDKEMNIWGAKWDLGKDSLYLRLKKLLRLENTINVSGYKLSDEDILEIYRMLKRTNPVLIKSYPGILYNMAGVFNAHKLSYQPRAMHTGGEKLHPHQRQEIETTFKTRVFDFYGARDMPNMAQNCDHFSGLHVFMENIILEVVDDDGLPIKEGEGDLVITSLHNKVMPFIRYRIGDRARISARKTCTCGRNLQLIDEILGRSFDIIQFPNGNRVGGSFWTLLTRSVGGIKDFQVIQEKADEIILNYVSDKGLDEINESLLESRIREYGGNDLKIVCQKVDIIDVSEAGKMKFVISKLP